MKDLEKPAFRKTDLLAKTAWYCYNCKAKNISKKTTQNKGDEKKISFLNNIIKSLKKLVEFMSEQF